MMAEEFQSLLRRLRPFKRVAIAGGHGVGKNYLAESLDADFIDTDEYLTGPLKCAFEEVPNKVLKRVAGRESFVLCGAQVPRCLRGSRDGTRPPLEVDAAVWLSVPYLPQSPGHLAQTKGLRTTWTDWRNCGRDHGVAVFEL
jgi:hypothetical protein